MEYRYLGSSGLKVSALSLGSWVTFGEQIDTDVAYNCMTAAYEAGQSGIRPLIGSWNCLPQWIEPVSMLWRQILSRPPASDSSPR